MKLAILLAALLGTAATAQVTCTFTNFGRPCGGDLAGSQITARLPAVQMDVTNAAPASVAILVLGGQQLPRPIQLPGSNCTLLVHPRVTMFAPVSARGAATVQLRLPIIRLPLSLEFQAVTLALSRNGRTAESTNGVTMVAR